MKWSSWCVELVLNLLNHCHVFAQVLPASVIRRYQRLMVRFHRLYLRLVLQPRTRRWNKSSINPTSQRRNGSVERTSTSLPRSCWQGRTCPTVASQPPCTCGSLEQPSQQCSCSSHQWPHPHTIGGAAHATSEQSAKVFSTKFYFPPIHESFLPWKFSAIRYISWSSITLAELSSQ